MNASTASGRPLSIAILGTRGAPPTYGGFETMAGELGKRLAARGHQVSVYCRSRHYAGSSWASSPTWEGVRRIELASFGSKYLETVTHAFLSAVDALRRDFDAVLVCNAANAFVLPLLRIGRIPTAINVDGIERKRKKWSIAGKSFYLLGETLSVRFADAIVADARVIANYYFEHYGSGTDVIAYGSEFPDEVDSDVLERLGLTPRRYVLYVSRFEPENNPIAVVEAFRKVGGDVPLVMVGGAPYAPLLMEQLRSAADNRVIFPGALYGIDYRTLQRNAFLYIQATEVGGTHPALIEAMASGGAVLANATPENREVGGDAVEYFELGEAETLSPLIGRALEHPETIEAMRASANQRARAHYNWDRVTDQYERLFRRLAQKEESEPRRSRA